jgi:sulfur carrier protein ThiS
MRVTFKLFAMLTDYLPQQLDGRPRSGNVIELDLPDGTTVQQVIDRYGLPARLVHLVLVDGAFVPQEQRASRVLADGQALAIWPPVAGG